MAGRPPTRKPDPRQQRLELHEPDFVERLRLLDAIAAERSGLSRAAWGNVVALLKAIAKAGDSCWASIAWLSEKSGLPRATLHRARATAIELGLLVVVPRYNQVGRTTSVWRVDWLAVAMLDRRGESGVRRTPTQIAPDSGLQTSPSQLSNWGESHSEPGESQSGMGESQSATRNLLTNLQNTTSTTPARRAPTNVPRSAWPALVVVVAKCGVNQAQAALQAACDAGCSESEAVAVFAYWQIHRTGWDHSEAALVRRLKCLQPGDDPQQGWPAWRKGYRPPAAIAQERQREAERSLARRQETPQEAARRKAEVRAALAEFSVNR